MKISPLALAALAGLAATTVALGQAGTGGTITDGNASFTQGAYLGGPTGTGPSSDFTVGGPGNPDHLSQAWWWYRIQGENRESAFNNATSATFGGALGAGVAELNYTVGAAAPAFTARMRYLVSGFGAGRGFLTQTLTITNTSSANLVINLFNYTDIDLAGTSAGDTATLNNPGGGNDTVRVTDGPWLANYEGTQNYRVASFPGVRNALTDAVADTFAGTGLPAGPGDVEIGAQWTFTLLPGASATASATLTIVPAPGSLALMGLSGLLAARRRRV